MKDILLVDDKAPFSESLADSLPNFLTERLNVISADNGKKAIEMLRTAVFDAVVADPKMPVVGVHELLGYLIRERPDIPVIDITALDKAAVEKGAKAFLSWRCERIDAAAQL